MTTLILFFLAVYFALGLLMMILLWAALDAAKWDDRNRGYDLLEEQGFVREV